jgi:hypothetical protein
MNFGFGLNNFGWNNWYGNNWYGNNWGIPITITIASTLYNSSRRGSSNSNTADTNRSYNSTSRTFSNDRSSSNSRTFRETGVTLIGAQILSILEEVAIEKERTAPLIVIQIKTNRITPSRTRTDTNNSRRGNATPTRSYTPAPSSSRNESYSPNRSSSNSSRNESYLPADRAPSSSSGRSSQGSSRRGGQ